MSNIRIKIYMVKGHQFEFIRLKNNSFWFDFLYKLKYKVIYGEH